MAGAGAGVCDRAAPALGHLPSGSRSDGQVVLGAHGLLQAARLPRMCEATRGHAVWSGMRRMYALSCGPPLSGLT